MLRIVPLASLLLVLGCGFDLQDGTYRFQRDELIRESCTLDPPLPTEWEGTVEVRGSTVTISFPDPVFHVDSAQAILVGRFDPNRGSENFRVNSTSEFETTVDGLSCLVFSHLQIFAHVEEDSSFAGTMNLTYSRQLQADPRCPFACVVVQEIRAAPLR